MKLKDLFCRKNRAKIHNGHQTVKVKVQNGYEPETVKFKQGTPGEIIFNRSNSSSCLSHVQSNKLQFSADLPLNQDIKVPINTDQKGEFQYTCGMGMFHGKVIIK